MRVTEKAVVEWRLAIRNYLHVGNFNDIEQMAICILCKKGHDLFMLKVNALVELGSVKKNKLGYFLFDFPLKEYLHLLFILYSLILSIKGRRLVLSSCPLKVADLYSTHYISNQITRNRFILGVIL